MPRGETNATCFFQHDFYFPALLVGGFTLDELLGKPWSQALFSPPVRVFILLSCMGFSIPTARRISSNECSQLTLSRFPLVDLVFARKATSMHSVRFEPTKLIYHLLNHRGRRLYSGVAKSIYWLSTIKQ